MGVFEFLSQSKRTGNMHFQLSYKRHLVLGIVSMQERVHMLIFEVSH